MGIQVHGGCRMEIADLKIMDCSNTGIYIGMPISQNTWGYEINVHNVRCSIDLQTAHAAGSVGLHDEQNTDSFVSQAVIIGYETGVASESSSLDFFQGHVWNVLAHGPLEQNFFRNGWGDSCRQCYADAPALEIFS